MPPPVLVTRSPASVATVSLPVAVSRLRMMRIGMIQMILKMGVSRSSFSG